MAVSENIPISEGMHIVLRKGNNMKTFKICKDRKVYFDKKSFSLNALINHRFGTTWEVRNGNLFLKENDETGSQETGESASDNRGVFDDMTSQKLLKDDIETMKEKGMSGQGIVKQLVDNSSSFKNKTTYSQAKYVKKKKEKHLTRLTVHKPNSRLISEMFFNRTSSFKIIQIRPDTLSQMLTCTNVQSGSKVIVLENCQGLLVASLMERLAGQGSLVQFHTEDMPVIVAINSFDFPKEYHDVVTQIQLREFHKVTNEDTVLDSSENDTKCENLVTNNSDLENINQTLPEKQTNSDHKQELLKPNDGMEEKHVALSTNNSVEYSEILKKNDEEQDLKRKHEIDSERLQRNMKKRETLKNIGDLLKLKEMDALLIACRFHPAPILMALLEYLASSRPFVVYSTIKEPLIECFNQLKTRGGVVNIQLTETWFREYQVLEERTHPLVTMSGAGGYLLTGIKVCLE